MKKNFLVLSALLFIVLMLNACSSYVDALHRQMDFEEGQQDQARFQRNNPNFDMYRNRAYRTKGGLAQNQNTAKVSSKTTKELLPSVKRNYESAPEQKPRTTAKDFVDNQNNASLWGGNGQDDFLFSRNNLKKVGDILLLKVQRKLKNEIALELSKAYPDPFKKPDVASTKDPNAAKNQDSVQQTAAGTEKKGAADAGAAATDDSKDQSIYDQISSVVIEEIQKDHLLLRGRKELLYKNKKRFVEVQALIARKDVLDDDSVHSDSILETQVSVID